MIVVEYLWSCMISAFNVFVGGMLWFIIVAVVYGSVVLFYTIKWGNWVDKG